MQKWKSIIQENSIFDDYRLVAAYSRNKNLASYLVSDKENTQLKEVKQLEKNLDSNKVLLYVIHLNVYLADIMLLKKIHLEVIVMAVYLKLRKLLIVDLKT